jgi:hypothetical protein
MLALMFPLYICLYLRNAAIGEELNAGYGAGIVGSKEDHRFGNLVLLVGDGTLCVTQLPVHSKAMNLNKLGEAKRARSRQWRSLGQRRLRNVSPSECESGSF